MLLRKPGPARDVVLKQGLERAEGVGRELKMIIRDPEPEDPVSRKRTARG